MQIYNVALVSGHCLKQTMHKEVACLRSDDGTGPQSTASARKRPGGGPVGPPWQAVLQLK